MLPGIFDKLGYTMQVYMTSPKSAKLIEACHSLQRKQSIPIREVASVVGLMVSSFSWVRYGPLFYRSLENEKNDALSKPQAI